MTSSSVGLIFILYLSAASHRSHGLELIETRSQAVNADGVSSVSCEYTAKVKDVIDVKLYLLSKTGIMKGSLCQKGRSDCHLNATFMTQKDPENPRQWLFILYNLKPTDTDAMYQCEFTVSDDQDLHHTKTGNPTRLLQGQKETSTDSGPPTSHPHAAQSDQLRWILIGLLALLFLSICVIICFYIKLKKCKEEYDNGTYVKMRKAPLLRNPSAGVYCMT